MPATINDHVLLLLSIKKQEQWIEFEHILEKTARNIKSGLAQVVSETKLKAVLDELKNQRLIEQDKDRYRILPRGYEFISKRLKEVEGLNRSYRMVYDARRYYPKVAKLMVPFLRNRAVSVVKIFSDDKDPINSISPSFVRYAKYKPRKIPNTINSEKELMGYVDEHAVDFIPYVHKLDVDRPDWLVFDLDAGEKYGVGVDPCGFSLLKTVAGKVCEVLEEYGIRPALKFSGSRGIQVWARIVDYEIPRGVADGFELFRKAVMFTQQKTEEKLQRDETRGEFYKVTAKGKPITTSTVAKKEERDDQILIDWSSLKPSGDVRAPYSIHYKTGLVSCPMVELEQFEIEDASVDSVLANIDKIKFELEESDGRELFRDVSGGI